MNEITKIHLARVSYDIDVSAKKELEKYLIAVRKSLGDEIDAMEDIEIRMTEILAARGVVKDSVITESDVAAIEEQLGAPADFSGEESSGSNSGSSKKKSKSKDNDWRDNLFTRGKDDGRSTKKFYRDTDNAVLGGVIAGLAAYTGWDVTLLRVLFVILVIFPSVGMLLLVYIVVWIVAPAAETASEKLEMRGESVDIESIKEQVKNAGERVIETGKETAERVKKSFQSQRESHRVNPIVHGIMAFFGIILLIGFVPTLIAFTVAMAGVIVMIFSVSIVMKPLFVASIILVLSFVFMLLFSFISLSVSMVRAKWSRGLWANVVIMFMLLMAAATCGGIWLSRAGQPGVERAGQIFRDELNVHVRTDGDRVKVDIGPIKIDTKK
ncbi:PspC domain-containing protein [Candidatus Saccharibacteria bacterium]|nr:PspC domain-containing protein [Candidatus Saccharibacteria bacterium]MCL1962888.1 PspC domain-containing protein [Candidatus Saccharibacteria bacterium]